MTEADIYHELNEIFRDVLVDDDITLKPETTADQVEGWNSFSTISILVAVEQRFGIKVGSHDIDGLKNVGALVSLIQHKI